MYLLYLYFLLGFANAIIWQNIKVKRVQAENDGSGYILLDTTKASESSPAPNGSTNNKIRIEYNGGRKNKLFAIALIAETTIKFVDVYGAGVCYNGTYEQVNTIRLHD